MQNETGQKDEKCRTEVKKHIKSMPRSFNILVIGNLWNKWVLKWDTAIFK